MHKLHHLYISFLEACSPGNVVIVMYVYLVSVPNVLPWHLPRFVLGHSLPVWVFESLGTEMNRVPRLFCRRSRSSRKWRGRASVSSCKNSSDKYELTTAITQQRGEIFKIFRKILRESFLPVHRVIVCE